MSAILISDETLTWLLDPSDPGASYLALKVVLDQGADDPELAAARQAAHTQGPIAAVLAAMQKEGYWVRPGPGYNPKYRSAVWSLILLAQLGAEASQDERIQTACTYMLEHNLTANGQFTESGAPSGTIDCLQGNLLTAMLDLGFEDERLDLAFEWMARTVTGEGIAPKEDKDAVLRYYAYKCGPGFACGITNGQPCAWGAVKVMLAFGRLSTSRRTPLIERAIAQGLEFFFSIDPATADYPEKKIQKPSRNWWKFGFPVFYVTDLLQLVEALVRLGCADDPRLQHALELIRSKQDAAGRWALEYEYTGKSWADFGAKKEPNKWVTIRALKVLKQAAAN